MSSETAKHRNQFIKYLKDTDIVLDIGCAGDPLTPRCISIDLAPGKAYCERFADSPIQIYGDGTKLKWFQDECVEAVYSSHLIEDFTHEQQCVIMKEWARVIKKDGYLLILCPARDRWKAALAAGQPPNLAHKNEPEIGELTRIMNKIGGFTVLEDRYADPTDYGLVFVAKKTKSIKVI